MPLTIVSTPKRTVAGILSDVSAGLTQLPYKFQRQDYLFTGSVDNAGYNELTIEASAGDITNVLNLGDIIWVRGTIGGFGRHEVTAFTFTTQTNIVTNKPYAVDLGAGFVNLLTMYNDYRVLLNAVNPDTLEPVLPFPMHYVCKQDGTLFVNVANFFVNLSVEAIATNYILQAVEYYAGGVQSSQNTDPVFAMAAKKQLLDQGGANLFEFLVNLDPVCKRMSEFKNPFTWIGFYTRPGHVFDSEAYGRTGASLMGFNYEALDANGVVLDDSSSLAPPVDLPRINTGLIPNGLKEVAGAYNIRVTVVNQVNVPVSELTLYTIKRPCNSPIMIEYINKNGIFENYLFSTAQSVANVAKEGLTHETPIDDTIDTVNNTLRRLTLGSTQYLTLFAENIPVDHVKALSYLKESPIIYIWLDTIGEKKIVCVVADTFDTNFSTKQVFSDFTVQIQLPRNFDYFKNR